MARRFPVVFAFLLLSFVSPALAETYGLLAGAVRHEDGSPFPGVPVHIWGLFPNGSVRVTATTDAQGRYFSGPLLPGRYRLYIEDHEGGYYGVTYPDVVCASSPPCDDGQEITISIGILRDGVDFVLRRGGSIQGRVLDSAGAPLPSSALVEIFDRMGRPVAATSQDATGFYDSGPLPPGRYTAKADGVAGVIYPDLPCEHPECDVRFGEPIEVVAGETVTGIDMRIPRRTPVRAFLRDAVTQQPIDSFDVQVALVNARTGFRTNGDFQGNGEWRFSFFGGVVPGKYYAVAWNGGFRVEGLGGRHLAGLSLDEVATSEQLEVREGEATTFEIALDPAARIQGQVRRPDGQPADGCGLRIFDGADQLINSQATCDQDGRFDVSVPPGEIRLLASPERFDVIGAGALANGVPCSFDVRTGANHPPRYCDLGQMPALELAGGQVLDLDVIDLPAPGRLEGRVDSADGPSGDGFVEVRDLAGRVLRSTYARASESPSFNEYFVADLAPGPYQVVFLGRPPVAGQVYPAIDCQVPLCDSRLGDVVVVPPGATRAGVDFAPGAALPESCTIYQGCLNKNRFHLNVRWTTAQGQGEAIRHTTVGNLYDPDTAYYWFFSPDNTELLVKVLDACDVYQRFWVFAAGTTNVGVDIEVKDSLTGVARRYHHGAGPAFEPVLDTGAFGCEAAAAPASGLQRLEPGPAAAVAPPATTTFCSAILDDPDTLCLLHERFRIDTTWQSFDGSEGRAQVSSQNLGTLFFFSPDNVELLLKVLDGCAINGHYWVFGSGLTNVGVRLLVTDTHTDRQKVYENPLGQAFAPILDTEAFRCWRD